MILAYHEIVLAPDPYLYTATLAGLREHLQLLAGRASRGCRPDTLTFDDGHVSHHRFALPALRDTSWKAIFFVTAGWTGTPGYMDVGQLRDLAAEGHVVESHGWSHVLLTACTAPCLHEELLRSKNTLQDWLGREVDSISIPGGACNTTVLRACADTGYRRVFVSDPWLKPALRCGVEVFGRLMVRNSMRPKDLASLIETEDRFLSRPRLAHCGRRALRAALGTSLYHRLWCWATQYHQAGSCE